MGVELETTRTLRIDVALTPAFVARGAGARDAVYVAIDVVRATTTLCVAFESGVRRVYVAAGIDGARAAKERLGAGYLLAGEVGGLAPEGFDLGNSPAEVAGRDLEGAALIFATTNGTQALRACARGRATLAGSLRNATAVMEAALVEAGPPRTHEDGEQEAMQIAVHGGASEAGVDSGAPDIVLVCAGRGDRPAYDDTLCAGWLVAECQRLAAEVGLRVTLGEGARIARAVAGGVETGRALIAALASSDAGRAVERVGLVGDLAWCADVNASHVVPRVMGARDGGALLMVEAETVAPRGDSGGSGRAESGRAL
jgi:2-phosphosulfolactate phosphatase